MVVSDGSQQVHISTRRPISTKGTKYSLPAPRGGKHAWNPRLTEDQREPQQRLSKRSMQQVSITATRVHPSNCLEYTLSHYVKLSPNHNIDACLLNFRFNS